MRRAIIESLSISELERSPKAPDRGGVVGSFCEVALYGWAWVRKLFSHQFSLGVTTTGNYIGKCNEPAS